MSFAECITWLIKNDCESEAIRLLNASLENKINFMEERINSYRAGMRAARKINNAKYKDDALDALLGE